MSRTTPIILEKDPSANLDDVARVASVWDEVVNSIVKEMIAYSSQKTSEVHINLREEMILELAKLTFFLSTKVVEDRMRGKAVSDIDASVELQEWFGPNGQIKIYNTAKNCAEPEVFGTEIDK